MTKLFRKLFPKTLSQDEIEFLKIVTIVGYIITGDEYKDDPKLRQMNDSLMAMWERRTKDVEGFSE